jgi:putative transposase
VISLEELRIGNLTRSAKGTIDAPGTNVAQKAGLNRSILDAAWGQFIRILTAKG